MSTDNEILDFIDKSSCSSDISDPSDMSDVSDESVMSSMSLLSKTSNYHKKLTGEEKRQYMMDRLKDVKNHDEIKYTNIRFDEDYNLNFANYGDSEIIKDFLSKNIEYKILYPNDLDMLKEFPKWSKLFLFDCNNQNIKQCSLVQYNYGQVISYEHKKAITQFYKLNEYLVIYKIPKLNVRKSMELLLLAIERGDIKIKRNIDK